MEFIYGFVFALIIIQLLFKYVFHNKHLSKITKEEGRALEVEFIYKGREYTTTLMRKRTQLIIGAEIVYGNGILSNIHLFRQNNDIIFPPMRASDFGAEFLRITATPISSGPTLNWSFERDAEVNLELIEKMFAETRTSQNTVELGDE